MQESENLSQPLPREEDAGVSDEVEDANIDESSNSTTQIDESWKDIVLKLRCCCSRTKLFRVNHNVFVNLVLSFLYGISNSLWNGTAFAAYLKQLGHNRNGPVGAIEAVSGLASLVTALPVGFLADKIGRSRVIAAGGLLLFCTSILQIFVLEWSSSGAHNQDTILWLMGVIMAFWGVGDGIVNGPAR
jgi:Na+/melibiose symporter-like transporter